MKKLAILISAFVILLTACGEKKAEEKNISLNASQNTKKKINKLSNNEIEINGVKVKVLKTEFKPMGSEEFQKKPLFIIHYSVTNTTNREVRPLTEWSADFEVYQDTKDVQKRLNHGIVMDKNYQDILQRNADIIKKGATVQTIEPYELEDDKSPVLIKARNLSTNESLGQIKVNIQK